MTYLSKSREELLKAGKSEFEALENQPSLKEIFNEIQKLKVEMNEAKRLAAAEAANPYLLKIEKLEKEYALLLKLGAI